MTSVSKLLRERSTLLWCVLLAVAVGGTFLPALHNGFINYDDPVYVYSNPHVTGGLTWANIQWAFRALNGGFWHPLTWLSIQLDCELFGLDAGGHHFTSILLHTASTVLLFLVLRRLTGAEGRSAFVAALFGVHPLHVESVVWACERKDVLSTFFCMLTLLAYAKYTARMEDGGLRMARAQGTAPSTKHQAPISVPSASKASAIRNPQSALGAPSTLWYVLALVCFTLGLMSKTMLVTVPFVLLLLDYWPLRRFGLSTLNSQPSTASQRSGFNVQRSMFVRVLLEKLPFLALAVVFGLLTLLAQSKSGAMQTVTRFPLLYRVDNALLTVWRYLAQTAWPSKLAVFYSYPRSFSFWAVAPAALALVLVTAAAFWSWRRRPYLAFGWVWYLVMLVPVLGFIQVGNLSRADRYTYLPLIGIFVLVAWGVAELATSRSILDVRRSMFGVQLARFLPFAAVGVAAACIAVTRQQIGHWHDSESVLRHAIQVAPNNELAHNNLGGELTAQARRLDQARRRTRDPVLQKQLQDQINRLEGEALREFQAAVQAAPDYAMAQGNLGAALLHQGRLEESIAHSGQAVKLLPNYAGAHRNLGVALGKAGRLDDALHHLGLAVQLSPTDVEARYNLSFALLNKGRTNEARAQLAEAMRLRGR